MIPRICRVSALSLVCVVLGHTAASAQINGGVAGIVRDSSGGVMPGVTVEASSPVLIEKVRTVITDSEGRYSIIDLRPGTYTVTFSLTGFSTIRREGIELTGGFTATVNADLRVGGLEETITVSGQSPLIDTQSVQQRKSLTSEMIDAIPTGRSFQSLSVLVPGVTIALGNQDVGGTGGERYQTLSVHGSRADQMPLVMNGMPYNNMNNTGGGYNTTLVQNTGTVQEMTVTTSALSTEWRTSGVLTNTIPKEGGNTFRGYFFGNFSNSGLQSDNLTDELRSIGLTRVNSVNKVWDVNPAGGGPIVKDRLWFYGGFRYSGAQNYIAGMYENLRPGAPQYCGTAAGCTYGDQFHPTTVVPNSQDLNNPAVGGDTWTRGETLNLTWQATQKNKITAYAHFNQRLVDCNNCSATTSPEAGIYFTHRPEYLLQATWSNPYTSRLLFEGGFTFYNERWIFGPQPDNVNGYGPDAVVSKTETTLGVTYGSANVFTTAYNHQYNMRAAMNYVTGSHTFKVGMQNMWGTRQYTYDTNQAHALTFTRGIPAQITQYARPLIDLEHLKSALGIYAQDRWTINRLTLNYGVRFDYHNAYVPEQTLDAIPFVPARQYDPIYNVPNWKDITPRIGGTYDLFGNGKTVARANWGKYLASESTNMATLNNRVNTSVNSATRQWTDSNGNFVPDCNLANAAVNGECGLLNAPLGSLNIAAQYSDEITRGWGVRPNDDEWAIGVQHEILPRVALDVQYTRHSFGNFVASQNTTRPPSAYDTFCVTAPTAPAATSGFVLPNAGEKVCGFVDLNPTYSTTVPFFLVQKASNFGDVKNIWSGYDINVNARLSGGGIVSGGVSIGHELSDSCAVVDQASVTYATVAGVTASTSGTLAPTYGATTAVGTPSRLYCRVLTPYQPDVKGLVSYPLPWWGLTASGTVQNRPGPQILATYVVNNTLVQDLGRNLNTGQATTGMIAPGSLYQDRFTQVDVRFGKIFRAGGRRVSASLDVYNLLNSSAILAQNNNVGPNWRTPTQILQGRLVKFGAQVDF